MQINVKAAARPAPNCQQGGMSDRCEASTANSTFHIPHSKLPCLALTLSLLLSATGVAIAQNTAVTITVDANGNRHAISPNIYGVAFGSTAQLQDLGAPLNRQGGNDMSCYNWLLNASNKGADWYFESIADDSSTQGERGDTFISNSKAANADSMITLPMIGWVAKVGTNRGKLNSYSIAKYGAQTGNDWQWDPAAGNGILASTGLQLTTNDPNDAQTPSTSTMQQNWVSHIVGKYGTAANGGVKYYMMDNEVSIWQGTHQDVHPVGAKMDEILADILDYGGKAKAIDPTALVCGPEEWGWSGYFYSGYDQQYGAAHNWNGVYPDRQAHSNMDYCPWLLQQLAANNTSTGKRTLDVFSLHCFPQGGEFGNDVSTNTELLRNKSTRQLWDPNYVDQSWIGTQVDLIPRMKNWVNTYYPGTKIGITEYNWGAEPYINGATAQADIYGIFGREGLDLATRWTTPDASTPTYKAMKMYRNVDGAGNGFGDTSVSTTMPNSDNLAAFGAVRTKDNSLTVMLVNKVLSGNTPVSVKFSNFTGNGTAQVWQLTSANAINRLTDVTYTSGAVNLTLPPQCVTLVVLPPSTQVVTRPAAPAGIVARSGNNFVVMQWAAVSGATSYNVSREDYGQTTYTKIATTSSVLYTDPTAVNGNTYYYHVNAVNSAGTGPASGRVVGQPLATAVDTAEYNFETSIQGWTTSGGMLGSPSQSLIQVCKGTRSLAIPVSASGAETQDVFVPSPPVAPGKKILYHFWIPAGSTISSVQPYVLQDATGNWTWTGNWQPIANLKIGGWSSLNVTVPSNAKGIYSLGLEFSTSAAWTGTVYVDTIVW